MKGDPTPEELHALTLDRLQQGIDGHEQRGAYADANARDALRLGADPLVIERLRHLKALHERNALRCRLDLMERAGGFMRYAGKAKNKRIAKLPRPSKRSHFRTRIVEMMRNERAAGVASFKTLFQRWEREPLHGLRLTVGQAPGTYIVDDEDTSSSAAAYTFKTLTKLYSDR